jgi:hypothetical protein
MAFDRNQRTTHLKIDRIRRQTVDPVFEHRIGRLPSKITVGQDAELLELRYHKSRWHLPEPDLPWVRQRSTRAKLFVDGEHAGSFLFTELRPEPLIDNQAFFEWADALSFTLSQLAEVLCSHWEQISEVSDYGTILELSRIWMNPKFSSGRRFGRAANALIALSKDWSLFVLKAFPLEYEGSGANHYFDAQRQRQRAMMRHYQAVLGVVSFPHPDGDDGWMYQLREGLPIAEPKHGAGETSDW